MPSEAEKLKKAFRSGEISLSKLYEAKSSADRVSMLAKYIGKDNAKFFTARLERTYMLPRQKNAVRNIVYKMFNEKPLYSGISIDKSKELSKALDMPSLKKMSSEVRVAELSKHLNEKLAIKLNERFEYLKKSGNLQLWEEKVMGTETLRANKRLKGSLAKLEALNDLGVLSPKNMENFMQTLVEDQMNISIGIEDARKLAKLTGRNEELFNSITKKNDWTYKNAKEVKEYFKTIKDIRVLQQDLVPMDLSDKINASIDYFRASILASHRIIRNSALYQILPTLERFIANKIVPFNIPGKELSKNTNRLFKAKLFSIKPTKAGTEFAKGQFKMAWDIYKETGFDISRMENLDDGFNIFGGEKFNLRYPTAKKLKDTKGLDKAKLGVQKFAEFISSTPKWTAGGTDMVGANLIRSNASLIFSKETAHLEASKMKFKNDTKKAEWIEKRAHELLVDSYSFSPKNDNASKIRSLSIFDARVVNNTQPSGFADIVVKMRDNLKIGDIGFGKALVPFAKIATASIARGVKLSVLPFDAVRSIYRINQASKLKDIEKAGEIISKNISMLIGNVGLLTATIILASFLDDDDYIQQYDMAGYSESRLGSARGAQSGSIRIGGTWVPIKYLPMVNIPLSAIMTARQNKAKGKKGMDITASYLAGILGGFLDTPVISDIYKLTGKIHNGAKSKEMVKLLNDVGLDGETLFDWVKVRAIPSMISYDLWNAVFPRDARYDFLGNETGKNKTWIGFRADRSNEITLEFNRLLNTGNLPTISEPTINQSLLDSIGKEEYDKQVSRYKQNYADKVSELIFTDKYLNMSDEDKKKAIDKIRKEEILDALKKNK